MSTSKFRTSDGCRLFLVGGEWVDSLDPEKVDMTYPAGRHRPRTEPHSHGRWRIDNGALASVRQGGRLPWLPAPLCLGSN
jgi:hypothetical protein